MSRRNIKNDRDLIAKRNEDADRLSIERENNNLKENGFEAIIVSGFGTQSNPNVTSGNVKFYRIKPIDGSDDGRLPIFGEKIRVSELKKRIHRCKQGKFYPNAGLSDGQTPRAGDVWWCEYQKKRYQDPIEIKYYIRKSGQKPRTIPDNQNPGSYLGGQYHLGYNTQGPTPNPALSYRGLLTYDDLKYLVNQPAISTALLKQLINQINPTGADYNIFNCGYPTPENKNCIEAVLEKYYQDYRGTPKLDSSGNIILDPTTNAKIMHDITLVSELTVSEVVDIMKEYKGNKSARFKRDGTFIKGEVIAMIGGYLLTSAALIGFGAGGMINPPTRGGYKDHIPLTEWDDDEILNGRFPPGPLFGGANFNSIKFDQEFQDVLALWTVLQKYPLAGGYLTGKFGPAPGFGQKETTPGPKWAAHEMSKEWIRFPAQYSIKNVSVSHKLLPNNKMQVIAGEGYYQDINVRNPWTGDKYKLDPSVHPNRMVEIFENARRAFAQLMKKDGKAREILERDDITPET